MMRLLFLSIIAVSFSLPLFAHRGREATFPEQMRPAGPTFLKSQMTSSADNKTLWKKIVARPDSVAVTVSINNSIKALIVISGKLNSATSDGSSNRYSPQTIKVVFPNGKRQVLPVNGTIMTWEEGQDYSYLYLSDMNFDGNADLHLFDNAGATGNFWFSVWLFDSNKKGFAFSSAFSDFPSPKIDAASKQVLSYYRAGACEEQIAFYQVQNNKLRPVKYIYSGENCETYQSELVGKEWKATKMTDWKIGLYDYYSSYHGQ